MTPSDQVDAIRSIPISAIAPSPFQPRRRFDQESLDRLASSIRTAGVMQPVLVRVARSGGVKKGVDAGMVAYELIAGERRWRAAKQAGLEAVPAVVSELSDEQAAEWGLIENLQREDLGAMERAWALRGLCEKFGLTQAQAAERVGLERSTVSNLIRLTELEPEIAAMVESGRLSMGHGRALLAAPAGPTRLGLARRAAGEGAVGGVAWSVRRTEMEASRLASDGPVPAPSADAGPEDELVRRAREIVRQDVERELENHLGTKVHILTNRLGTKGRIAIEFYDLDHFDALLGKLGCAPR